MTARCTVVIPYRASDDYRVRNFNFVRERWALLFPDFEVVVCDSGDEVFDRSKSRNAGVAAATGDVIIAADADTIPIHNAIQGSLDILNAGAPWVIAHDGYCNLNQEATDAILRMPPDATIREPLPEECDHYMLESWAGMLVLPRAAFDQCGGWDEGFIDWGYEDNAFQIKMDTLWGHHYRPAGSFAAHLWHPAPDELTFGQPHIAHNRARFMEYKRANGSRAAMRQLV